jgi:hypothetical protein
MTITTVQTRYVTCLYGMLHIRMKRAVHPAKLLSLTTRHLKITIQQIQLMHFMLNAVTGLRLRYFLKNPLFPYSFENINQKLYLHWT